MSVRVAKFQVDKEINKIEKVWFSDKSDYWKWSHWIYNDQRYFDTFEQAKKFILSSIKRDKESKIKTLDEIKTKLKKLDELEAKILNTSESTCKSHEYGRLSNHPSHEFR